MDGALLIFGLTILTYIPLAAALLFVWWKYGKEEPVVSVARVTFLCGSFVLIGYMLTI